MKSPAQEVENSLAKIRGLPDFGADPRFEELEFWQGRENRLHDPFLYVRGMDYGASIDSAPDVSHLQITAQPYTALCRIPVLLKLLECGQSLETLPSRFYRNHWRDAIISGTGQRRSFGTGECRLSSPAISH